MGLLLAACGGIITSTWKHILDDLAISLPTEQWCSLDETVRLAIAGDGGALAQVPGFAVAVVARREEAPSDDAVRLIDAYRCFGAQGLTRLGGEYAYAIWDEIRHHLIVGCDALGLLSMCHLWDGRTFLASSRSVALLRHPDGWRCWDDVYVAHVLSGLWAPAASTSAFRGVRRMAGGEVLRISRSGIERLAGDQLNFQLGTRVDAEVAAHELTARIDSAVDVHLRRSHRICIAWSGGLDSSVVAASVARREPACDAFRLRAQTGPAPGAPSLRTTFPMFREHWVNASRRGVGGPDSAFLSDDAIAAAPAYQPARLALLGAARDMGFERMLDGEGGDELFELAWRLSDFQSECSWAASVLALKRRSSRTRFARGLLSTGDFGALSRTWLRRERERIVFRRPWLTRAFWESHAFGAAWEESLEFARKRHARDRIPQILDGHARYQATQEIGRMIVGVRGSSPLLDRRVVEFVGALPARIAIDSEHSKGLLRRVASARLPASLTSRPKEEPLYEQLAFAAISDPSRIERIIESIEKSQILRELIDPLAVRAALDRVRLPVRSGGSAIGALDQLFSFVEWNAAVSERYAL